MALLPKSRTARKRLYVVATSGAVLIVAAVLAFLGLGDAVSFFYTPTQAAQKHPPVGRVIQLGGFVQPGSLHKAVDGKVTFTVTDCGKSTALVAYDPAKNGELPDLFREGQGVVTKGAFQSNGDFTASQVLAKHDERYMPRELTKTLKQSGEWRGDGQTANSGAGAPMAYQACTTQASASGASRS